MAITWLFANTDVQMIASDAIFVDVSVVLG